MTKALADRPRQLSLAALSVVELSPPDMVSAAAEAGFDYISLRVVRASSDDRSPSLVGDEPLMRAILARLADTGLSVLDAEVFRLRPETQIETLRPAVEAAARLGARHLLSTCHYTDVAAGTDAFAALCELAAPYGLTVDLEFMPFTPTRTMDHAKRIVMAADCPNGGILVDALHFYRTQGAPDALAALPPNRLHFAQICDARFSATSDRQELLYQARNERLYPGEGDIDLAAFVRALPATIPFVVEAPKTAEIGRVPAVERARQAYTTTRRLLEAT